MPIFKQIQSHTMKTANKWIILSAFAFAGLTFNADSAPESAKTFTNPIISGDWSDPGIVRVGEDYYTVRSSFGWQPGLHIAHSKDLIHWKYIGFADTGNAFDRAHGITEPGIWGSDIGYNPNNKTFLVYAPKGGQPPYHPMKAPSITSLKKQIPSS
jgi:beta-xylosidase